jgi:hypothetical protein
LSLFFNPYNNAIQIQVCMWRKIVAMYCVGIIILPKAILILGKVLNPLSWSHPYLSQDARARNCYFFVITFGVNEPNPKVPNFDEKSRCRIWTCRMVKMPML